MSDGQRIRIGGRGEPGERGGPAGDLYVQIRVRPHDLFGRSGDDLTLTVPVTFAEAALGTDVRVPTLDGAVTVRVPAATRSGLPDSSGIRPRTAGGKVSACAT